jgi:hypothetical protein
MLVPPSSALTRGAVEQAERRLSPALLNHSYRAYAFGAAGGALDGLTVDTELLFAAALLHDTGLPTTDQNVDFTRSSARIARDVAGLRSWRLLTPDLLAEVVDQHPRLGFTGEFTAAFRTAAACVPRGRVQFLRYGAFDLAFRLAPFRG